MKNKNIIDNLIMLILPLALIYAAYADVKDRYEKAEHYYEEHMTIVPTKSIYYIDLTIIKDKEKIQSLLRKYKEAGYTIKNQKDLIILEK